MLGNESSFLYSLLLLIFLSKIELDRRASFHLLLKRKLRSSKISFVPMKIKKRIVTDRVGNN